MGFALELLEPMAEALPEVSRVLLKPFLERGPFHTAQWELGPRLTEALGAHRWNFRAAGPASLLYVLRAFHGLLRHLELLDAPLDWGVMLDAMRLPAAPAAAPRPPPPLPAEGRARFLRVRLEENGRTRVELTFRAEVTRHLVELLPDDLPPKLAARGLDAEAIAARALAEGLPPSQLFGLDEDGKCVRVWLE
jgi:hypothetical protein